MREGKASVKHNNNNLHQEKSALQLDTQNKTEAYRQIVVTEVTPRDKKKMLQTCRSHYPGVNLCTCNGKTSMCET